MSERNNLACIQGLDLKGIFIVYFEIALSSLKIHGKLRQEPFINNHPKGAHAMAEQKELKATFAFCALSKVQEKKPDLNELSLLVGEIVSLARKHNTFTTFYVLYEHLSETDVKLPPTLEVGGYRGSVVNTSLAHINTTLDAKLAEEEIARTQVHESYQPPKILSVDTCIVVLGQRQFCAAVALAHLKEITPLRYKTFRILVNLCGLEPYRSRASSAVDDVHIVSVHPDDRGELVYNIRWWYDVLHAPVRMTEAEARQKIGLL